MLHIQALNLANMFFLNGQVTSRGFPHFWAHNKLQCWADCICSRLLHLLKNKNKYGFKKLYFCELGHKVSHLHFTVWAFTPMLTSSFLGLTDILLLFSPSKCKVEENKDKVICEGHVWNNGCNWPGSHTSGKTCTGSFTLAFVISGKKMFPTRSTCYTELSSAHDHL